MRSSGSTPSLKESGPAWTAFLRDLVGRGLSGVRLVVSDSHTGLVAAIDAVLPGAAWQRCRTHFMRNVLCRVPKSAQPFVATLVRTIFAQPSPEEVAAQLSRVIEQLSSKFPDVAIMLEEAAADITAFSTFPTAHWRQIWSNNPQERLNRKIRRRSDVVGIFPNRESIIRLVGAVLSEQHDEWQVARRYMSAESLDQAMRPILTVEDGLAEGGDAGAHGRLRAGADGAEGFIHDLTGRGLPAGATSMLPSLRDGHGRPSDPLG